MCTRALSVSTGYIVCEKNHQECSSIKTKFNVYSVNCALVNKN